MRDGLPRRQRRSAGATFVGRCGCCARCGHVLAFLSIVLFVLLLFRPIRNRPRDAHLLLNDDGSAVAPLGQLLSNESAALNTTLPMVLVVTTTGDDLLTIKQWLRYHSALGVGTFFLFLEGQAAAPTTASLLGALPGVRVFLRTPELEYAQARSRVWSEKWLTSFMRKPCNHALFVRQNLNLETAIAVALEEGRAGEWVVHIDTDELLYPAGTSNFSLPSLFASIPPDVDSLILPNYESAVERADVGSPFTEVTLFKRNFDHVHRETYFARYRAMTRTPNYFLAYGNGKAAARLAPGLRPNGAHRFHSYARAPREATAAEAAVLHYTYARYDAVASRRLRCPQCSAASADASACFILDFDRLVFQKSSTLGDAALRAWYASHVVWADVAFVRQQLANGLFARIHAPALLMLSLDAVAREEDARDVARVSSAAEPGAGPTRIEGGPDDGVQGGFPE